MIGCGQKCPKQWKKFLISGENKITLKTFLLDQWSQDNYVDRIGNLNIYFAIEHKCFCLSVCDGKVVCGEILELNSNHEEADTKVLLHPKHASDNGEFTIIIKSPDTEVAIMACHFHSQKLGLVFDTTEFLSPAVRLSTMSRCLAKQHNASQLSSCNLEECARGKSRSPTS